MKVDWSDSLASGNELIDSQHKQLFDHMNTFFNSINREFGHEITVRTLNFLVKYVSFHFSSEEELMRSMDYPLFKEHLAAHRKIVDELMRCYKKLIADGHSDYILQELRILLQEWFVDHIMVHDMALAKFVKENG